MTKDQFIEKYQILVTRAQARLYNRGMELWASGAINPDRYGDNYQLPRIVFCAALANLLDEYREGWTADDREEFNNLRHF